MGPRDGEGIPICLFGGTRRWKQIAKTLLASQYTLVRKAADADLIIIGEKDDRNRIPPGLRGRAIVICLSEADRWGRLYHAGAFFSHTDRLKTCPYKIISSPLDK